MSDEELAGMLADDLDGSIERLVLAYQDRLYAFALRQTRSPRDAEEIAQDAFVRAYRAMARYPADRVRALRLRPWLYQIAVNVLRNRVRGRRLETVSLGSRTSGQTVEPRDNELDRPEQIAELADERRQLEAALDHLPDRYRLPLVLRHVEDLPYAEVATLLGQPVGTVKANVHRGIKLLRQQLVEMPPSNGAREHPVPHQLPGS